MQSRSLSTVRTALTSNLRSQTTAQRSVIASIRSLSTVQGTSPLSLLAASAYSPSLKMSRAFSSSRFNSSANASSSAGAGIPSADDVHTITVFGAGLMGAGIAQVAAQAGYKVVMCDVTDKALANGLGMIEKSLSRVAKRLAQTGKIGEGQGEQEKWRRECLERIRVTTDSADAVQSSDLVVEAIVESLKIKNELFGFIDTKAPPHAIFASNTSSLGIADIGSPVSEDRKKKFAGLHFFNPVPAMRLVELIRTEKTDPKVMETLLEVTKRMDKVPVNCKDTPGFIVNRLLMPYLLESVRMAERGEATPEDIDLAMELGAGYPMGPFKLLDFIGLDTTHNITSGWREKAGTESITKEMVEPIPTLQKLLKEGRYGRKNGKGFYDYSSKL